MTRTRKVSLERSLTIVTIVSLILSGIKDVIHLFSRKEASDIDSAALIRFTIIISYVVVLVWLRKHPNKNKIIKVVHVLGVLLVVAVFLSISTPCAAAPVCTAGGNNEPTKRSPANTPFGFQEQPAGTPSSGQTVQLQKEATAAVPSTTSTPSLIIPSSATSESDTEVPGPEGHRQKPTCEILELAKTEGPSDWPYTVKTGDTLFAIAHDFLGDGNRWVEIYQRNTETFGDLPVDGTPPKIYPGQYVVIPNVISPFYITVEPGDTLTNLGGKVYGSDYSSGRLWCTLYWQNPDRIGDDPSFIHSGQKFVVYPLLPPSENEILVPPDSTFAGLVSIYYGPQQDVQAICSLQLHKFGDFCADILPFDLLFFPGLPPLRKFRVGPGQRLEDIVSACYGEITMELIMIAKTINRKIIGDDPTFIHVGQVLTLYGCKG